MRNIVKLEYENYQVSFNNDGWINATSIAKKFGKRPVDWLRNEETLHYLVALHSALGFNCVSETQFNKIKGLDSNCTLFKDKVLILSKKTGLVKTKSGSPENGGGTWLHPKLAVAFARWLSIEFEIWCDLTIDNLINRTALTYEKVSNMFSMGFDEAKALASLSGKTLRKYRDAKPMLQERQLKLLLN